MPTPPSPFAGLDDPPRDVEALGLTDAIGFMLRPRLFVAWIGIVFGVLTLPIALLLVTLAAFGEGAWGSAGFMLVGAALYLVPGIAYRRALTRRRERRVRIVRGGVWRSARVTRMTPWPGMSLVMMALDRRVSCVVERPEGGTVPASFVTPLGLLSHHLEVGSRIKVLELQPDGFLFPEELGVAGPTSGELPTSALPGS